jgi:hypothetical protein
MVNIKRLYSTESSHPDSGKTELKGAMSMTFKNGKTLDEFCRRFFDNYDSDRFEAVAIRLYYGKEMIVTLYALDRTRQEGTTHNLNKIPVKKFKKELFNLSELIPFVDEFNFTLQAGNYPLEDMEVINK